MLHRDYVELGLEEFGMQDIWMLKDSLQVIQEELSLFGNAEDLRGFNGEFFGSLIALVDSCTLHLHFASSIFDIDPVCHGLCERTITAAQSIRTELIAARAVAAMQRAERGLVHDVIGGELMTIGEV